MEKKRLIELKKGDTIFTYRFTYNLSNLNSTYDSLRSNIRESFVDSADFERIIVSGCLDIPIDNCKFEKEDMSVVWLLEKTLRSKSYPKDFRHSPDVTSAIQMVPDSGLTFYVYATTRDELLELKREICVIIAKFITDFIEQLLCDCRHFKETIGIYLHDEKKAN